MSSSDHRALFLDTTAAIARAAGLFEIVLPEPDRFALSLVRGGRPVRCTLESLYLETARLDPAERARRVDRWLDEATRAVAAPADRDGFIDALRVVVRTPATLASGGTAVWRHGPGWLRELLVIDRGDTMAWVTEPQLAAAQITAVDAFAHARRNVGVEAGDGIERLEPEGVLQIRGPWAPSRLLLTGWLDAIGEQLQGAPIAAAPTGHLLLVAGSDDLRGVARLAATALALYDGEAGPLSPVLYAASDGAVVPWTLPEGHPAAGSAAHARARQSVDETTAQSERLRRRLSRSEDPASVPALEVVRRDGGPLETMVRWRRGEEVLLVQADLVGLDDGGSLRFMPWAEALESVTTEPVSGCDPPRLRARDWPA